MAGVAEEIRAIDRVGGLKASSPQLHIFFQVRPTAALSWSAPASARRQLQSGDGGGTLQLYQTPPHLALETELVVDGSASSDHDEGAIAAYSWAWAVSSTGAGNASAALDVAFSDNASATTTVRVRTATSDVATYQLTLTVTDRATGESVEAARAVTLE